MNNGTSCPPGKVYRKGYTHKSGKNVKGMCVKKPSSTQEPTNSSCPPGHILRRSYTRKMSNSVSQQGYVRTKKNGSTYRVFPKKLVRDVQATCIVDPRAKGKVPKGTKTFGDLKQGELKQYGYSYRLSDQERRNALTKAVNKYGALKTFHKLDAVAKLTKTTIPKASTVFSNDRNWISSTYLKQ
jgi:hypothetical protein